MIGTMITRELQRRGADVVVLTRREPQAPHESRWDPPRGAFDERRLDGLDAVLNLMGAPIADRPWTKARRVELRQSRVESTRALIEGLARLSRPPRVFIGAGGLGRFGDRGDAWLDDDASPGTGFLAELSQAWEDAHHQARRLDARVAVLRMSIVLSSTGGAFPLMVKPFRLGIGGWLGNGKQYTSWVSARDAVSGFLFALDHPEVSGGYNLTVPDPPTNYEWVKALGRALHRPVLTHAPKWALRGAFGELADDLLLASTRARPTRLLSAGFTFQDTDSEATFAGLIAALDASRSGR